MASKMRGIRVPDDVWENAKHACELQGVPLGGVIVDFLRTLKPTKQIKVPPIKSGFSRTLRTHPEPINQATCTHGEMKELLGHPYCRRCGLRLDKDIT